MKNTKAVESLAIDFTFDSTMQVFLNDTPILHLAPAGGRPQYDKASFPWNLPLPSCSKPEKTTLRFESNSKSGKAFFKVSLKAAIR